MKSKLLFCFILFIVKSYSQENPEILRGRVSDAATGLGLKGAKILISGNENYTTNTDTLGYFSQLVEPGTYAVVIRHPAYKSISQSNIVVFSGKQRVEDFLLKENKVELDSVTVTATNGEQALELDMWNLQRYAAVFYDPARMASSYAAIINTDDQANNVSIHGTSPNYIQWKVEGVEVVNPNHLENAGTINDKPALNGGGVSLFSAQMLQNSNVQLAPFDPSSGNALSGIFDMKLRNGNNQKYERVLQLSLLGTDFSMEGPLSRKKTGSFLFNYRYSTVGILSKLGVDFGGEQINYQDLSLVLTYPLKNGQVRLFSLLGNSSTIFRGGKDSAKFEVEKDLENIDYHSFTNINGINFLTSINNTLLWRTVVAYSTKTVGRQSASSGYYPGYIPEERDRYHQQKISTSNYFSKRFGTELRFKAGADISYFINEVRSGISDFDFVNGHISDALVQPFVSFEGSSGKVDYRIGLHGFYQPRINEASLQPRCMVTYRVSQQQYFRINYGISSQLQPFYLYLSNAENNNLLPTTCNAVSFIHKLDLRGFEFKSELFYQYFTRIPEQEALEFSAFNYFNEQTAFPLVSTGKAASYGYDLTIEKNFKTSYFVASGSVFESVTDGNRNGRFNSNYNISLTAGKEYAIRKNKIFSTDLRFFIRDGFLEQRNPESISDYTYDTRLARYYRIDMRISYRKNKKNSSVIWGLDLQNLTNRKNEAYHKLDRFTRKMETRHQLGLIPVLSYKILF